MVFQNVADMEYFLGISQVIDPHFLVYATCGSLIGVTQSQGGVAIYHVKRNMKDGMKIFE